MNTREALDKKKQVAEKRFEEIGKQIEQLKAEQYRLQGEHRTLVSLMEEVSKKETPVDEAGVIDVEPTLKEQEKKNGKQ